MKGIIYVHTETKWWIGTSKAPFSLEVKNTSIIVNQIKFLKKSGCSSILILNYSEADQDFSHTVLGERWGINIQISESVKKVENIRENFEKFLGGDQFIYIEGVFYFNELSLNKGALHNCIIIRESSVDYEHEFIDSIKKYYELSCVNGYENELDADLYTIDSDDYYQGINTYIGKNTIVSVNSQIGNSCVVGDNVKIMGQSILSSNSCIGSNTTLNNCLVMKNSIIQPDLEFSRCLITPYYIYDYHCNRLVYISDPGIVKNLEKTQTNEVMMLVRAKRKYSEFKQIYRDFFLYVINNFKFRT